MRAIFAFVALWASSVLWPSLAGATTPGSTLEADWLPGYVYIVLLIGLAIAWTGKSTIGKTSVGALVIALSFWMWRYHAPGASFWIMLLVIMTCLGVVLIRRPQSPAPSNSVDQWVLEHTSVWVNRMPRLQWPWLDRVIYDTLYTILVSHRIASLGWAILITLGLPLWTVWVPTLCIFKILSAIKKPVWL